MSPRYHVTIFSTTCMLMLGVYAAFVGFFFFTYGAYIEKKVVSNQIQVLLDDFTEDFIFLQNKQIRASFQKIGEKIGNIKPPDLSAADAKIEKENSRLVKDAAIVLSITFHCFLDYFYLYLVFRLE